MYALVQPLSAKTCHAQRSSYSLNHTEPEQRADKPQTTVQYAKRQSIPSCTSATSPLINFTCGTYMFPSRARGIAISRGIGSVTLHHGNAVPTSDKGDLSIISPEGLFMFHEPFHTCGNMFRGVSPLAFPLSLALLRQTDGISGDSLPSRLCRHRP